MDSVPNSKSEARSDKEKRGQEQFPVDIKVVRAVSFETVLGDIMRIVVMNDLATPRFLSYREYHYGNPQVPVDQVSTIVMRTATIDGTEQAIDTFGRSMCAPLEIPQVVAFERGIHSPTSARSRLFKATDPDDSTKMIGLLIEQDEEGRLGEVTWYKTREARAAFRSIPKSLEFQVVTNESGTPSLDPNAIGGWTWHRSTSLGIDLSA